MNDFYKKSRELEAEKNRLREQYRSLMLQDSRYIILEARRKELQEECGKAGHVRGRFLDNGLGYSWYYCKNCGAIFDKNCYLLDQETYKEYED